MRRFVASQLRHRPSRALSLGVAILVASVSFVLLAAAARTSGLKVTGSVKTNFRPAYDILVRPQNSKTQLERQRRLVRDNYLSGIFGGIGLRDWHEIEGMPGVQVAAPIANIGYVLFNGAITFSIDRFVDRDPYQLYRLRYAWVADSGTSVYPDGVDYVYYNRDHRFTSVLEAGYPSAPKEIVPGQGTKDVCLGFGATRRPGSGPFYRTETMYCYSSRSPRINRFNFEPGFPHPPGIGAMHATYFPVLLAAIDPVQEQRLLRLNRAVTSGRYLTPGDRDFVKRRRKGGPGFRFVPILASSGAYARETLRVGVERLQIPKPAQLPDLLVAGLCRVELQPCPSGATEAPPRGWPKDTTAASFLGSLRGPLLGAERIPIAVGYRSLLAGDKTVHGLTTAGSSNYWTTSETRYRAHGDVLEPATTTNPDSVWTNPLYTYTGGYWPAPADNQDVQFRHLRGYAASNRYLAQSIAAVPRFAIVGHYDPAKLPGFSPLSKVPLETYYPPLLQPADAASRKALGGKPLAPTQNVGDYIQQPPLMLTTIKALDAFSNQRYFYTKPPLDPKAPISVIRVRVAGVSGPDSRSQARIRSVALRIHDQTGLDVDITAGSSPHPLTVRLPPGKFGRPALTLSEGWVKKGVSAAFLHGVGRKQLALFTLIPLLCCLFLGNGTYAAARARRTDIGTLLTLGWSRRAIFSVLLGEVVLIAVVAGLVGVALAAVLVAAFSLDAQLWVTLLVLPLAVAIAFVAGLVPAWRAARLDPLAALRPPVADVAHARHVRHIAQLAVLNLRRVPGRALVGAAGLLLGACALTVLLAVQTAFQGVLAGTLLGDAIAVQIRGFDYFAVALVIALAALSIADVMYLNLRERQAELVTLRTLGWGRGHLAKLVGIEGLVLSFGASVVGAALGVVICALFLAVPSSSLAVGALAAIAGGIVAALAASALPLSQLERLTPPSVLAADE